MMEHRIILMNAAIGYIEVTSIKLYPKISRDTPEETIMIFSNIDINDVYSIFHTH